MAKTTPRKNLNNQQSAQPTSQGATQAAAPAPAGAAASAQPVTPPASSPIESQEITRDVDVAPISAGRVVAQGQATPENALETLIPVGTEASALREQAFKPRDELRGALKAEFDMGVTEKHDILGVMLDAGTHTFSAAAAIVGAHLPGLEEHQVDPSSAMTPRVADPIATAQLDFDFRPEPIFADIVDATTFKIQLNNEEVTHA